MSKAIQNNPAYDLALDIVLLTSKSGMSDKEVKAAITGAARIHDRIQRQKAVLDAAGFVERSPERKDESR